MKITSGKLTLVSLMLSPYFLITSCGEGKKETPAAAESDTVATAPVPDTKEFTQIPSPNEMFSFIRQIGNKEKNISLLNPVTNISKYVDNRSKALNFGVYAADLLYCSTFEASSDIAKYFAAVKKLGDEIGVATAISENTASRITSNLSNADSLGVITNDVYYSAFDNLESNNRGNILSLVIAGGWIESIHLAAGMVNKFDSKNPVVDRLADQKYTLDNLMEFLSKYKEDADVSGILIGLNELKTLFDEIKTDGGSSAKMSMKNGKRILSGGSKAVVTEEQFKMIIAKVNSIRNSFTQTN